MPATPHDLRRVVDDLAIAHSSVAHPATFTVEEGRHLKALMPDRHSKTLFLKDKDGTPILVSAWAESALKLNRLHRAIGTKRLSFASAELMAEVLGVAPGSVTPFALINDTAARVRFILDAALAAFEPVNFHPLVNTETLTVSVNGLRRFVEATGHGWEVVDFSALD